MICQDSVVDKIPSKRIWEVDHKALGGYPFCWPGNIDRKAVDGFLGPFWVAHMNCALETVGAGHGVGGRPLYRDLEI